MDDTTAAQGSDEPTPEWVAEQERKRELLSGKGAASRVRGMMLGLALGDTLGGAKGKLPAGGPLRAGVSTQLACFTVEGTIRACVRDDHKGMCDPPSVVWHAYCRWAALQGIESERMRRRWASYGDTVWPDGWLAQVPVLAERRGSAPATVAALTKIEQGTIARPTTPSRGSHALTRTLRDSGGSAAFCTLLPESLPHTGSAWTRPPSGGRLHDPSGTPLGGGPGVVPPGPAGPRRVAAARSLHCGRIAEAFIPVRCVLVVPLAPPIASVRQRAAPVGPGAPSEALREGVGRHRWR